MSTGRASTGWGGDREALRFRRQLGLKMMGLVAVAAAALAALAGSGVMSVQLNSGGRAVGNHGGAGQLGDAGQVGGDGPVGRVEQSGQGHQAAQGSASDQAQIGQGNERHDSTQRGGLNAADGARVQAPHQPGSDNQSGTGNIGRVDRRTSTERTSRTDSRTSTKRKETTQRADGNNNPIGNQNGSGQQFNGSTSNTYESPDAPVKAGSARVEGVESVDGRPGITPRTRITVRVSDLPNNGNRLFLVCNLLATRGFANLYYGRVEITGTGRRTYDVAFGGDFQQDPALVGTVRMCGVVSADPIAAATLVLLMDLDRQRIVRDPASGRYFDDDRIELPSGCAFISNQIAVTIERLDS